MRRFWIALATLIATFSSAPAGSVQQGALDPVAQSAPPALAVARAAREPAFAELLAPRPQPDPEPALLPLPVEPPRHAERPYGPWAPAAAPDRTPGLPRLLERLPYRATAPPHLA